MLISNIFLETHPKGKVSITFGATNRVKLLFRGIKKQPVQTNAIQLGLIVYVGVTDMLKNYLS